MRTVNPRLLELLTKREAIAVASALTAVFGVVDILTGTEIIFSVFYLLPVVIASWFGGRLPGITISCASVLLLYLGDYAAGMPTIGSWLVYWDAASRLILFLFISFILVALRDALLFERELSRTDPLTGAANSRAFYELAERELERARRYGYGITVAYMDIDNFKTVNDTLGHAAGDRLLRMVAAALQESFRAVDVVARVGGDEFVVLLPQSAYEEAHRALRRLHDDLSARMSEHRWPVTLSVGAVSWQKADNSIDEIIKAADRVMYKVKNAGKNSVIHEQAGPAVEVRDS